jgi:hypothetical protein
MPEAHNSQDTARDLDVRAIRIGAIVIACGILFALVAAFFLLRARGPAVNTPTQSFRAPAPLLQAAPQVERSEYFAEKARLTGSYGWVDRQAGIAHIPVEEAMRVMAARMEQGEQGKQAKQAKPGKEAP